MLREICKKYTQLTGADIEILSQIEQTLPLIGELHSCDMFIDCPTLEKDTAIVVAEYRPPMSMYENSVVGQFAYRKNEPAALRTLEIGIPSRELKALTQEKVMVKQNVTAIRNHSGNIIGVLIMERDFTKHYNANSKVDMLVATTEQLTTELISSAEQNSLAAYVNDAIVLFSKGGIAIYANPVAKSLYQSLGYKDDIIGMTFENLALGDNTFESIRNSEYKEDQEVAISGYILNIQYSTMDHNDVKKGIVMLVKDITYLKTKEKEIILKSVAIREIHHRVKNNLQTVASLLRLQSRRIKNKKAKKMFGETINRILSIALTHEILAQSGVDEVDIKEIITRLVKNTISYGTTSELSLYKEIEGDSFTLSSDKATAVALVVNELLQNCIDHAFIGRGEGAIWVKIDRGSAYSVITIKDDGIGFDPSKIKQESLGITIVKSMVKDKLEGSLHIVPTPQGTVVTFDFKN